MSSTRLRNSGRKCAQVAHDPVADVVADLAAVVEPLEQVDGTDVGRHDHDRVAEVDGAALGVGEAPVVEDRQQGVEHVGVGLLDLVEQHDAVGLAAHGLGELAALLVADVAGRRAHQPADGVALLVLAHVQAHHVVLGVEQRLGQRTRELGLAHPGGAEEDERPDRPARVLDPGAGADDRVGDELDRLVLADDTLVQDLVETQQLLALASISRATGMPVQRATTWAISSSVTSSRSSRAVPCLDSRRSSSPASWRSSSGSWPWRSSAARLRS
jgi:hypothetical protein